MNRHKNQPVRHAPERVRRVAPCARPDERAGLRAAEYRLGVKARGEACVETLLFLTAGGLEIGYYTIHSDPDGCFVDFTFYDEEKEVRAVYERFAACGGGETLTGALARDLRTMGYFLPGLDTELTELRLTCDSGARCSPRE